MMRAAYGVLRIVVVCVALIACSNLDMPSTTQPDSTPHAAASQTPAPLPVQSVLRPTSTDCNGDTEPPILASGWKLLWQKVFDNPIARPPTVSGEQALLIQRADPTAYTLKDTVMVINPASGATQWKFPGVTAPPPYRERKVTNIYASAQYWFVVFQYVSDQPGEMPEYKLVLDRTSGEVVYSNTGSSGWMAVISDEALYDDNGYDFMRRFDLPSGVRRWENPWADKHGATGLFPVGQWLYYFNLNEHVYQYDSLNGTRVATGTLNLSPQLGDILIANQLAIIRSWDNKVGVFDLTALSPKWVTEVTYRANKGSNAFFDNVSSMAVTSNSIYLFDSNDDLLRLDLLTGKTIWRATSRGPQAMSRPVVSHGLVYGFFSDGTLQAYSETDGRTDTVMHIPLWYRRSNDSREFLDLYGGLGVWGDTVIITTGCRSVYAIQRTQ